MPRATSPPPPRTSITLRSLKSTALGRGQTAPSRNYQTQLAYYKAGNSKVKYKHDATGTAAYVWCRSAYCHNSANFCSVYTSGGAYAATADNSLGVAPLLNV